MFLARAPDAADDRLCSEHLLGFLTYSKKRSMKEGSGSKKFERMKQGDLDKMVPGEEFLVKLPTKGELNETRTAHVIGNKTF